MSTDDFDPTPEQADAITKAANGANLAIEALAGTGKTSTLKLIGDRLAPKTGHYLAFNKQIAAEAKRKMPTTVHACTVHKLAYDKIGVLYRDRLDNQQRSRYREIAQKWNAPRVVVHDHLGEATSFSAAAVTGYAIRTVDRFCMTADEHIEAKHVPRVNKLDAAGKWANNDEFARRVAPIAQKAWDDLQAKDQGLVYYTPSHFLKMWQLTGPTIHSDFILYDEAQDANPVMLDIIQRQDSQLVFVGDPNQQIYGWNGAVDAMEKLEGSRARLTKSFRFGPNIAEIANGLLTLLEAGVKVTGAGRTAGIVDTADRPDVILCRTNAETVSQAIYYLLDNRKVAIVGGVNHVVSFAKAARDLMDRGWTSHNDLAVFNSWVEVVEFCRDPSTASADIDGLVKLVDEFGTTELIARLRRCVQPHQADIVLSTAHKSKGLEWPTVKIAGDFANPEQHEELGAAEHRLMYVAVTRAQSQLDIDQADWLNPEKRNGSVANVLPLQEANQEANPCN